MPIQSARVLVIDDSPLRRATLARRLEALGYGALLAESGQDAGAQWRLLGTDPRRPIAEWERKDEQA